MSAVSMDTFVRDLFSKTTDFSSISQRSVRDSYMKHMGIKELSEEQRDLLKQIVTVLVSEMNALKEKETGSDYSSDLDGEGNCSHVSSDGDLPVKKKNATGRIQDKNWRKEENGKKNNKRKITKSVKESDDDDDNEREMTKKRRRRLISGSDDDGGGGDDSDDGETLASIKKKSENATKKENSASQLDDESMVHSGEYLEDDDKQKKNEKIKSVFDSDNNSSCNEEEVSSKQKNKNNEKLEDISVKKNSSKKSIGNKNNRRSSDEENIKKKSSNKDEAKKSKQKEATVVRDPRLVQLEKIARYCGAMPVGKNYKIVFEDCKTDKQRCEKIKQLLRDAGMEGPPSLKAAEKLKLDKEIQELNQHNIISSEGRTKRNVFSIYSRNEYKPVARAPSPSLKQSFSNLKGIIDSDEDSD